MCMTAPELRKKYINFFKKRGHAVIPSTSLIPEIDPTVLFTTAGMHPLIPYLMGQPHPQGKLLVNCQKCFRTGDIEEVGDTFHLTFFEMLGNWSLGDYFKREAIEMAMEFLTNSKTGLGLDKAVLSVTVYEGDDQIPPDEESAGHWEKLGIPRERIYFLPKEENFWGPVGETGPCGPDTEIFFDVGLPSCSKDCRPGCGCGKFVEIWNLVFMGYDRTPEGKYVPLKQRNIDTGMGLERALQTINGYKSVYETDLLNPLMEQIQAISGITKPSTVQILSMRIIVDHVRSAVMALADDRGLVPSNVEQGYVIRRLLRVAIRKGLQLGIDRPFLTDLIIPVVEILGAEYTELRRNQEHARNEIAREEKRFHNTVRRGLRICERILKEKRILTGKDAFMLFSTYGFPLEMTMQIAKEKGQEINVEEFRSEFERHQKISRDATQQRFTSGLADHSEEVIRLHTATHLLQAALRKLVSDVIYQKGSNITQERLRLDVHLQRKLTKEELQQIEKWVNDMISKNIPVTHEVMSPEKARAQGALSFFGEKYGDQVTVYTIGDISKEICSGPHVKRTGELGTFHITKQKRIGADTLRLRAVLE
jgi:alanyl-tRNA synthetase